MDTESKKAVRKRYEKKGRERWREGERRREKEREGGGVKTKIANKKRKGRNRK